MQVRAKVKCFVDNTLRNQDEEFEYNGDENPCLEILSKAKSPVKAPEIVEPAPIPPGFSVPKPAEVDAPDPAPKAAVSKKSNKK